VNEHEGVRAARRRVLAFAERHGPMLLLLPIVWWLAVRLQYKGQSWGDDFALYVRQAKSLYEGNIGQVIADNHYNVLAAAKPTFSPFVYPWGWPIILSPFLRIFGLDYAKLKLVEVALFAGFLWVFHELIRARANRWVAFGVVASLGTTLVYLQHTDQLLSELPYMFAVVVTLWYLDRVRRRHHWLQYARRQELVTLGLMACFVFNTRREGLAMIAAIVVAQAVDLRGRWRGADRRLVATPLVTFLVATVLFQLLLPSALIPEYKGSGLGQTWKKLQGPFRTAFMHQLGMHATGGFALLVMFALVVVGIVVRVRRAPERDAAWVVFAIGSMTIAGTIPAVSDRYLMGVTPFALYFAAQAIAAVRLPHRLGPWVAAGALLSLTVSHLPDLSKQVSHMQRLADRGQLLIDGPEQPYAKAAFDAVRTYTHMDDVIEFFKVRDLTLYTDRRGVQSGILSVIRARADFYLMRKGGGGGVLVTPADGASMGWTIVWQDPQWILWKVKPPSG
jgi:hypothetical protein